MDSRIVYGMGCTWWDSISNVETKEVKGGHKVPCCPHCGSVLFEVDSEELFLKDVDKYEKDGHPNYRKTLLWSKGKCFKTWKDAMLAHGRRHEI